MRNHHAILASTLLLACTLAHAQYVWIDAQGTRQYSDRPPPVDTPASSILKAPASVAPTAPPAQVVPTPPAPRHALPMAGATVVNPVQRAIPAKPVALQDTAPKPGADTAREACRLAIKEKFMRQYEQRRKATLYGTPATPGYSDNYFASGHFSADLDRMKEAMKACP